MARRNYDAAPWPRKKILTEKERIRGRRKPKPSRAEETLKLRQTTRD